MGSVPDFSATVESDHAIRAGLSGKVRSVRTQRAWKTLLPVLVWLLGVNEALAQPGYLGRRVVADLSAHGWVVVCDIPPEQMGNSCGSPALQHLGTLAYRSARILAGLGFKWASLSLSDQRELAGSGRIFEIVDPDGASQQFPEEYFVLTVQAQPQSDNRKRPDGTCCQPVEGHFDPVFGTMLVKSTADGGTVIHELFHAVQWATIQDASNLKWIIEGTAAAVEALAPDSPKRVSEGFRFGPWRNWHHYLNGETDDGIVQYQVAEFWLSLDGSLNYLHRMFLSLQARLAAGPIDHHHSYAVIDQALQDSGAGTLRDGYMDLIEDRSQPSVKYPHCEPVIVFSASPRSSLFDAADPALYPITAKCLKVDVEFLNPTCKEPNIKLELDGLESVHFFFVDGVRYGTGRTVDVKQSFTLWTVNLDTEFRATQPRAILTICGLVSIIDFEQSIAMTAVSTHRKSGELHQEIYNRRYLWDVQSGAVDNTTWTSDGATVPEQNAALSPRDRIRLDHRVSVAQGATARAEMTIATSEASDAFVIDGSAHIDAKGTGDNDWMLLASAKVSWSISLTVKSPSTIEITNCPLFDQKLLADQGFTVTSGTCTRRAEGSSRTEIPSVAGLPGTTIDLTRIPKDRKEMLDALKRHGINIEDLPDPLPTDQQLAEARRLASMLTGQVLFFRVSAEKLAGNNIPATADPAGGNFSLRIIPDPPKE